MKVVSFLSQLHGKTIITKLLRRPFLKVGYNFAFWFCDITNLRFYQFVTLLTPPLKQITIRKNQFIISQCTCLAICIAIGSSQVNIIYVFENLKKSSWLPYKKQPSNKVLRLFTPNIAIPYSSLLILSLAKSCFQDSWEGPKVISFDERMRITWPRIVGQCLLFVPLIKYLKW